MQPVAQLVDLGVRAYVEGRLEDARRLLDDALRRDPANARARSYLILLHGGFPGAAAPTAPAPGPGVAAPILPAAPAQRAPPPPSAPAAQAPALTPAPFEVTVEDEDYAPSPWDDGPAAASTIVLEAEGGMDLGAVADKSDLRSLVPETPASPRAEGGARPRVAPGRRDVDVWMAAAKDLHALGDFSGSLEMIEKILKLDPEHGEARDYLRQNEATLVAMYESKLGPLGRVPRLAIKPEEVMWLNLDHRAGFLLSQIDGKVDYESLFALSGLPRLDTARILATLIGDGVIAS
jgi:tetratricopeptide (TPR) repeat protein